MQTCPEASTQHLDRDHVVGETDVEGIDVVKGWHRNRHPLKRATNAAHLSQRVAGAVPLRVYGEHALAADDCGVDRGGQEVDDGQGLGAERHRKTHVPLGGVGQGAGS